MSGEQYLLKPLPNDGTRGYRVEIDEFLEDNEMTNLFLIALHNLQTNSLEPVKDRNKKDIPNWLNYYAAASIHGSPTEDWNGIKNPRLGRTAKSPGYGYCHHGMNTFPVWHRPYMAFYESIIYKEMARVAEQYSEEADKAIYGAAAARFRLPFWDIVMPRNKQQGEAVETVWGTPAILAAKNVFVKLPKLTSKTKDGFDEIPNPLFSFTFPSFDERKAARQTLGRPELQIAESHSDERTMRCPSKDGSDKTSAFVLNLAIQRQASAYATLLLQMLNPDSVSPKFSGSRAPKVIINEVRSWSSFANHSGSPETFNGAVYPTVSVESFHDGIHTLLGIATWGDDLGNDLVNRQKLSLTKEGHMGNPRVAAFDPIFWLHHNNIERLLCLYQAIYPDKEYPGKYLDDATARQDLVPFLHESGNGFWKGTDPWIKNYWNSGFAVPGAKQPQGDSSTLRKALTTYLNDTYRWAANKRSHNLKNWPKDLKGSWALLGPKAAPVAKSAVHMSAITTKSGHAQLVHRELAFAVPDNQEVLAPTVQDTAVKTAQVLELTEKINNSLPAGALENLTVDEPTYQLTWNAHVKVRKFAFEQGSFNVHLFVGHVKDEQPERFMTKKNEAGFTGVFTPPLNDMSGCSNCVKQREEDVLIEDTIPLTSFLYSFLTASEGSDTLIPRAQKKTIDNLTPEEVVPFLKENLQWRMTDLANNLLHGEQQAGLEILVSYRTFVEPDRDHLLGQYGPFVPQPEITNERPGGWGYVYATA